MSVKLEDFPRQLSKIALVVHRDAIRCAPGLMEGCEMLFGSQAQERFDEYFQEQSVMEKAEQPMPRAATVAPCN